MSLWVELYPTVSADIRFTQMLGQPGSTPLDLFKFYVEDLKSRFYSEKKIIKEILKEKSYEISTSVTFEDFATVVCEDKRSASLDAGNVKLTYNALLEKAESREKERLKEEARKLKKLETNFRILLSDVFGEKMDSKTQWEDIRSKLEGEAAFEAIPHEYEKVRMFKDFQKDLEETCMHNHGGGGGAKATKGGTDKRKEKKAKKEKRRRRPSTPPSSPSDTAIRSEDSEGEIHSPKKDRRKSSTSSKLAKKERKEKERDSKYYSDFSDSEFSGPAAGSDFSEEGKKVSKKSKSKKSKKSKERDRSRSMETISPPPLKKRKSDKNDKSSGSLSPVSEEDTYAGVQSKPKKSKKGNKKQKSSKEESVASKDFDRVSSPSPPPSNPSSRRHSERSPMGGASSAEEGELSEDELEKKRMRLLRELQEDS